MPSSESADLNNLNMSHFQSPNNNHHLPHPQEAGAGTVHHVLNPNSQTSSTATNQFSINLEAFNRLPTATTSNSNPLHQIPQYIALDNATAVTAQALIELGTTMQQRNPRPPQHHILLHPTVYSSSPYRPQPQRLQSVITHTGQVSGPSQLSSTPSPPVLEPIKTTFTIVSIDPKVQKGRPRLVETSAEHSPCVSAPSNHSVDSSPVASSSSNIILPVNSKGVGKRGRGKRGPAVSKELDMTSNIANGNIQKTQRKPRSQKAVKPPSTQIIKEAKPRKTPGRKKSEKTGPPTSSSVPAAPIPVSKEMPQLIETNPNLRITESSTTANTLSNSLNLSQVNTLRYPVPHIFRPGIPTLSTTSSESVSCYVHTRPNLFNTINVSNPPRTRTPIIINKLSHPGGLQLPETLAIPFSTVSISSTPVASVTGEVLSPGLQQNGYINQMNTSVVNESNILINQYSSKHFVQGDPFIMSTNSSPSHQSSLPNTLVSPSEHLLTNTGSLNPLTETDVLQWNSVQDNLMGPTELDPWTSSPELETIQSEYLDGFSFDMLPPEDTIMNKSLNGTPNQSPKKMTRSSALKSANTNLTSSPSSSIDSVIEDVVQGNLIQVKRESELKCSTQSTESMNNIEVIPIIVSNSSTPPTTLPSFSSSFKNYPAPLSDLSASKTEKTKHPEKLSDPKPKAEKADMKKASKVTKVAKSKTPITTMKVPNKRKRKIPPDINTLKPDLDKQIQVMLETSSSTSAGSGVVTSSMNSKSAVITHDPRTSLELRHRIMEDMVTLTHPTSPPTTEAESQSLSPKDQCSILMIQAKEGELASSSLNIAQLKSNSISRKRNRSGASFSNNIQPSTSTASNSTVISRKRNRSGGSIPKTRPKVKVVKEKLSGDDLKIEKRKQFLESDRQRKAILSKKPGFPIAELLRNETSQGKPTAENSKALQIQNWINGSAFLESNNPPATITPALLQSPASEPQKVPMENAVGTEELKYFTNSNESLGVDTQIKVESALSEEGNAESKKSESSKIYLEENTENKQDGKVTVVPILKNGVVVEKRKGRGKARVSLSKDSGIPEKARKDPKLHVLTPKNTRRSSSTRKPRTPTAKNIVIPEKNFKEVIIDEKFSISKDQELEELFSKLLVLEETEDGEDCQRQILDLIETTVQQNESLELQSFQKPDTDPTLVTDDDLGKLNEVLHKTRISYSDEEREYLYSPGMFIVHRTFYDSPPELCTIWRIKLEADGNMALLGHDPWTRQGSNKWFHCYKYRTDNKKIKTKKIDLHVGWDSNLLFGEYFPVFVTQAVDTEELSIVKYYHEPRATPYLKDVKQLMDSLNTSFRYYLMGILYQTADPNFMMNYVYSDADVAHGSLLSCIREGFHEIEVALKQVGNPYIASKYSGSEAIQAALQYPKLTLRVATNIDKARACDMCPEKKKPHRICFFGSNSYNRVTFEPNEGPQDEEKLQVVNDKKLQLCFHCCQLLRNFHNLFHHSIHIYYCCYFRYRSAISSLTPDANLEVSSWVDAVMSDVDWIIKMQLDFVIVLAQSMKDAEAKLIDPNYHSLNVAGNENIDEVNGQEQKQAVTQDCISSGEVAEGVEKTQGIIESLEGSIN